MRLLLLASPLVLIAACGGDDPVSYSDPVGLSLSIASGDVVAGVVADEKNVNTESGNPYGAFLAAAENALGSSPSEIAVDHATLELEGSTNVAGLGDVFTGDVQVRFLMGASDTAHIVATRVFDGSEDAGPIEIGVVFDSDELPDADYDELASGSFKVEIVGDAAPTFADANADANLSLTLTFTAYE